MKITYKMIKSFEESIPEKLFSERNMFFAKILYQVNSNHFVQQKTNFEKLSSFARKSWCVKALMIRHEVKDRE